MEGIKTAFLIIQLLACISAIYYWKYYRQSPLWIFMPFLIYSFLNEVAASTLYYRFGINPKFLYVFYTVISFLVYLYWFDKLLKLRNWKWVILLVFAVLFCTDIFLLGISKLLITSLLFQAVVILSFSLTYFSRLLRSDHLLHYHKIPDFWIILGLLMFNLAFIPLSLYSNQGPSGIGQAYSIAINVLNYILYSCYIIAFYVSRK